MENTKSHTKQKRKIPFRLLGILLLALSMYWLSSMDLMLRKTRVGAIADVTVLSSGAVFKARVDTGAGVTAIHCISIEIEDESLVPLENIGNSIRFQIENEQGERFWIQTEIVDYGQIRSIDAANSRYYVRLVLSCDGIEKNTLVTLCDRSHLNYKMLLGRDFLENDFVVDVMKDNELFR